MPTLWFGFDGTRTAHGDVQGDALEISFIDFSTAFGDRHVHPVPHAPHTSHVDSAVSEAQHVVLEIDEDELMPPLFTRAGFYLIEGLSPSAAREALHKVGMRS
jgi:hypothetical protein